MANLLVPWTRLVRYVSDAGTIKYGEPILPDPNSDINQLALDGKLEVIVLEGTDVLTATPTNGKELVETLLGPLTAKSHS
jgi:hypothetical protein